MLGSNLPVDGVPVCAAPQVCTGTLPVWTVGRQQLAKITGHVPNAESAREILAST